MEQHSEYNELLKRHWAMVWRMCWVAAHGNYERCRDLVQEVCIALWLHLGRLRQDSTPKEERAWVRYEARTTLDHQRRRQRPMLVELTDAMAAGIPDTKASATEEIEELMAALSPDEQRMMRLYIEGYRGDEIATMMNLRRDAVYQRMHRAVSKARRAIVVLLLLAAASSIAVAVVPQWRDRLFRSTDKPETPTNEPPKTDNVIQQTDTVPAADTTPPRCTARVQPMPHLAVLPDTMQSDVLEPVSNPCGCPDRVKDSLGQRLAACDFFEPEEEPATEEFPEATITVNGNIITVEGVDNETASVFDDHGRLVAIAQCNGHCVIVVPQETLNSRMANPAPHWVQVGSRPRQRVYLHFKSSRAVGIW